MNQIIVWLHRKGIKILLEGQENSDSNAHKSIQDFNHPLLSSVLSWSAASKMRLWYLQALRHFLPYSYGSYWRVFFFDILYL